jgi:hypothetical protein
MRYLRGASNESLLSACSRGCRILPTHVGTEGMVDRKIGERLGEAIGRTRGTEGQGRLSVLFEESKGLENPATSLTRSV